MRNVTGPNSPASLLNYADPRPSGPDPFQPMTTSWVVHGATPPFVTIKSLGMVALVRGATNLGRCRRCPRLGWGLGLRPARWIEMRRWIGTQCPLVARVRTMRKLHRPNFFRMDSSSLFLAMNNVRIPISKYPNIECRRNPILHFRVILPRARFGLGLNARSVLTRSVSEGRGQSILFGLVKTCPTAWRALHPHSEK